MPLSSEERIRNTPLNGGELRDYALWLLRTRLVHHAVLSDDQIVNVCATFLKDMQNDYVFSRGTTYPNVEILIEFRAHATEDRFAYTLTPQFFFPNPTSPTHTVFIHRPLTTPMPPLTIQPGEEQVVDCFSLRVKVNNPNLVRVHLGMPITITKTIPPDRSKNKPMATFEEEEIRYDPKDYDALPPPTFTDESRLFADRWSLKGSIEYPTEAAAIAEDQRPIVHISELGSFTEEQAKAMREAPTTPALGFLASIPRGTQEANDFERMLQMRKRAALLASGIELSPEERAAAEKAAGIEPTPGQAATEALMQATNDPSAKQGELLPAQAINPDKHLKKKAKKRSRT